MKQIRLYTIYKRILKVGKHRGSWLVNKLIQKVAFPGDFAPHMLKEVGRTSVGQMVSDELDVAALHKPTLRWNVP